MNRIIFIVIVFLAVVALDVQAQEVKNMQVNPSSQTVEISYDLEGTKNYNVKLYYSTDEGQSWIGPLQNVSGDIGPGQIAGKYKKIVWNVANEIGSIDGYMKFKIVANKIGNIEKPEYIKQKNHKNFWLVSTLITGGIGAYAYIRGNQLYDDYTTATTDAASIHDEVELYDQIYPIALGVAGFSALEFIIHAGKQAKAQKMKKLTISPVPIHNGGGINLAYTF